ncbi:MAG: glycosyltransferase family 4 protein [Pirellulales bacterium]|nr:glycosyltransferase family 4 protein [Pirellulales bacterium]
MASLALVEYPGSSKAGHPQRPQEVRPQSIRVLHVINGEHYAGAERVQDLLAQELPQFGFQVGLACIKPGRFPEMRQTQDVPLYELPMRHRFDLRAVWRLVQVIRREGYQLVHAHTARSALIAALASIITGVPMVHHVHSPTAHDTTHRWRSRINALVERLSLARASALIAVSASLGRHTRRRGFRSEKVSVVPNGVPSRRPVARRLPPRAQWTLGTVALFRPRKGLEVLLQALATLRSQGLAVRLRAVGDFETPEYQRRIQDLVEELSLADAIDWTGFRQDIDAELAQMDLFVLPSLFGEGLPMVVLEAMAAGVPVVATRVEGVPEAVRDGRDGVIVEPNDPDALAAGLQSVVTGRVDWQSLRESAARRHASRFSEKSMAAGVAEVYRRLTSAFALAH